MRGSANQRRVLGDTGKAAFGVRFADRQRSYVVESCRCMLCLISMIERPRFLDRPALVLAVCGTLVSLLVHVGGWAYSGFVLPRCAPTDEQAYCTSIWVLAVLTLAPPIILLLIVVRDRIR